MDQVAAYTEKYSLHANVKGHRFTQLVVRLLLKWAKRLSWKTAYLVGTGIGLLLYRLKIRRRVAMINLDIVYGTTKSSSEKERIYKASMLNVGRVVINYLRLPYMGAEFWEKNCDWKNEDILLDALNRKRGVILVGCHIGIMDLSGGKLGMSGYPVGVVAKTISHPVTLRLQSSVVPSSVSWLISRSTTPSRKRMPLRVSTQRVSMSLISSSCIKSLSVVP